MHYERILEALIEAGWKFEPESVPAVLPDSLLSRYPALPVEVVDFLCKTRLLVNASETAWFLTALDFNGQSESAFAWNEFEQLSLEAAGNDSELASEIREFWNLHIPVLLSVKSGYSYFALKVAGPGAGSVVHGVEPEFEDATVESTSFREFLELLVLAARGELGESVVSAAV